MLNLSAQIVSRLPVALPSVDIQTRIASALLAYDDLIENNRRRIALLEESARLLYREWFVQFRFPGHEHVKIVDGVPEGWEPRRLSDIVGLVNDGAKPDEFDADEVHIGLEHIRRRSFTLCDWEPAEGLESGKIRFLAGDILFSKIRPYFHKAGFAIRSGVASSDAIVWRVQREEDWPFAVCAISSDRFVAVASKTVREGSKMPRADLRVLHSFPVPKPTNGVLQAFNEVVLPITEQCKTLAMQSRALSQARDLLLPRLMSGKIAV